MVNPINKLTLSSNCKVLAKPLNFEGLTFEPFIVNKGFGCCGCALFMKKGKPDGYANNITCSYSYSDEFAPHFDEHNTTRIIYKEVG